MKIEKKKDMEHIHMTDFEKRVCKAVLSIPIGEVRSYKWVAQKAGRPDASRAVGQIMARNPYPFIIPCHRVIGSDKQMTGYAFGVVRKTRILGLEREIKRCLENKE